MRDKNYFFFGILFRLNIDANKKRDNEE
jgi:hypothetical protein